MTEPSYCYSCKTIGPTQPWCDKCLGHFREQIADLMKTATSQSKAIAKDQDKIRALEKKLAELTQTEMQFRGDT